MAGYRILLLITVSATLAAWQAPRIFEVKPALGTQKVTNDPDDPAIWINQANPEASLVLGTNKVQAPHGALVVFGLDGQIRQTFSNIDRPNNVDVEYDLQPATPAANGTGSMDIAVVTERLKDRLRVFSISAQGVREAGTVDCCREPMGVGLYRRPRDGAIFAIVAPKGRPDSLRTNYLLQFRLENRGGKVTGTLVRRFGLFSGTKEIEAVAVDDELGFVYYADEGAGIRKYHADPDHAQAAQEVAVFGTTGYRGDREGLALYTKPGGAGFLISTDQLPFSSEHQVYARGGDNRLLLTFKGGADTTDGVEVTSTPLGPRFPAGLFVAMNSAPKNFLFYDMRDILKVAGR
ncbi:MAG: phytase [Acidobacteria bacterium]|nr:phytase [Acidobacteriota bacterium]